MDRKFRKSIGFVSNRHFRRRLNWELERINSEKSFHNSVEEEEITFPSFSARAVDYNEIPTSASTREVFEAPRYYEHVDQGNYKFSS